ncbi:glycerol-3-phosphate dehydrogenase/oxidase [Deltaproteobacteria bacterium TL4]
MDLKQLQESWDLVIIGGGITGAGIFREASRLKIKVLLVEQKDFAWGTSSRSSKLVHGGLRYLKQGNIVLTRDSVVERERLLKEAPGLVEPLGFLMPIYEHKSPGKMTMTAGLSLYSLLSGKKQHQYFKKQLFLDIVPQVNPERLKGGFRFYDAQVDDARLVLRVLQEAKQENSKAAALNYTQAKEILRDPQGNVTGILLEDTETKQQKTLKTKAVINATGTWAEQLHTSPKNKLHIRPLRGSHLIFPAKLLPLQEAVSIIHPKDDRPIFALPWEGAILLGTTDVDHNNDLSNEPYITKEEADYLMAGLHSAFPEVNISLKDCIASIAGVRPVLSEGEKDPSEESREHVLWVDQGLVTITGGKLTTFRRVAVETLKKALPFLPIDQVKEGPVFSPLPNQAQLKGLTPTQSRRLQGRYGNRTKELLEMAQTEDLAEIPGTFSLWAELPYTAKNEGIRHLSDLLLRRVRVGLLIKEGGMEWMPRIQKLCQPVLDWDEQRWKNEIKAYHEHWKQAYSLPH